MPWSFLAYFLGGVSNGCVPPPRLDGFGRCCLARLTEFVYNHVLEGAEKGFVDACRKHQIPMVRVRSQYAYENSDVEYQPCLKKASTTCLLFEIRMLSISRASKRPLQTAALPVAQRWWYPYDPSVRVPDEEESSAAAGKGTDASGKRPARMARTGDPGLGSRFSFWCVVYILFFPCPCSTVVGRATLISPCPSR